MALVVRHAWCRSSTSDLLLRLSHVSTAGNLMLSSSGATDTALNYDPQYRTIIRHGWVRID